MPEIRKDPVLGRNVIIASERGKRPTDLLAITEDLRVKDYVETCPFCMGNEEKTPPEIDRMVQDNRWMVRVVPNKFPALSIESKCKEMDEGLFTKKNGLGYHEVIIESGIHSKSFFNMDTEEFEYILKMYRKRDKNLMKLDKIKYVSVFKNYKKKAGASLEHPHSQIMALPMVPNSIVEELEGSKRYYEEKERCIYCDMIREEIKSDERVVINTENFLVLEPYASIYNYETVITPKAHIVDFNEITDTLIRELAIVLKDTFSRMEKVLGDFPFNMYVHTLPKGYEEYRNSYHWHIVISPRLSNQAGFELGSGVYINTVAPEDAARSLRDVKS